MTWLLKKIQQAIHVGTIFFLYHRTEGVPLFMDERLTKLANKGR